MAKRQETRSATATYKIYPGIKGDLWLKSPEWRKDNSGKFELDEGLSQKELKYIFDNGHTNIVYKLEE